MKKKTQNKSSKKQESEFELDMVDALYGPIILPSSEWSSTLPEKLKERIPLARMMALIQKEKTATIPEAVAYLMALSLQAPMSKEWTNIYVHCSSEYIKRYEKKEMEGIEVQDLSADEKRDLQKLRDDIYKSRRRRVKERIKNAQKDLKTEKVQKPPNELTQRANTLKQQRDSQEKEEGKNHER